MSQYQMNQKEGHLEALYLVSHFMWKNPKKRHVMYPSTTMIDEIVFRYSSDWVEFYKDVVKEDPPQMPEPLGEPVLTSTFFNSDRASNFITRGSHTGILLFFFNGLIKVFSKRHNTFESNTFGSEMVALCIARDLIVELIIKLFFFNIK